MARPNRPPIVDAPRWRSALKDGRVLGVERFATVARAEGDVSFIASTSTPDRYGDTVNQSGWKLDAYQKNPVLLWAHDYSCMPVGKVGKMEATDKALVASSIEFTPPEISDFGAKVGEAVRAGFLNTFSVGFLPIKWEERISQEGVFLGYNFIEQELLENSVVPVPANSEALATGRAFVKSMEAWANSADGSDVPGVRDWKEEVKRLAAIAEKTAQQATDDADADAFLEVVELLKEIRDLQKSHLELTKRAIEGSLAKSVNRPDARPEQDSPGLSAVFGTLFTRR